MSAAEPMPLAPYRRAAGERYTNGSQLQVVRVMDYLSLMPLREVGSAELADTPSLELSRDQAHRTLQTLAEAGWLERTPGGGYRIAPAFTQVGERLRRATADLLEQHLGDHRQGGA